MGAHYFTTHGHDILVRYSTKVNKVPLGVGSFLSQWRVTSALMTLSLVGHSFKSWPSCKAVTGKWDGVTYADLWD